MYSATALHRRQLPTSATEACRLALNSLRENNREQKEEGAIEAHVPSHTSEEACRLSENCISLAKRTHVIPQCAVLPALSQRSGRTRAPTGFPRQSRDLNRPRFVFDGVQGLSQDGQER